MNEKKISIIYIISNIDKALAFEWIATNLNKQKFDLKFILLNPGNSAFQEFLILKKIDCYFIKYRGKKDFLPSFFKVCKILWKENPHIIHTHLFDACLLGLAAGKYAGISKRIFTRHHGNQHHIYFPKAVLYDKLINRLATKIIAPSESVKNILLTLEKVEKDKVKVIHHGFDLSYFQSVTSNIIKEFETKYNPKGRRPVIGVISRYTELKGLQYIIPAFKKLTEQYPDALLILSNASGDYKAHIEELLSTLNPGSYLEIQYEQNVAALYHMFDVFVHAPVQESSEAFGQTYIEALAVGIPSVFTISGVANEFILHKKNAYVVPYQDSEAIYKGILELIRNGSLANSIKEEGLRNVTKKFQLLTMIKTLEDLYEQ